MRERVRERRKVWSTTAILPCSFFFHKNLFGEKKKNETNAVVSVIETILKHCCWRARSRVKTRLEAGSEAGAEAESGARD